MNASVIVLILSYNGKELLKDAIASYLQNDYYNFRVVVIDNGSTDGTQEWVAENYPQVFVLRTDVNLKYSGGFNFGLRYAFDDQNADFVVITNNDVVADRHLISSLVEAAENDPKAAFVIGKVYYHEQPDILQTVGKKADPVLWNSGHIGQKQKDTGQFDKPEERAWCDDIFWLVRREVYERTGGYDTEFAFQGEDFDWQVRAKLNGFHILYTPKAKLWHKESMTIGKQSSFKAYYDARNPLIVHMKYRDPEEFRKFFHIRLRAILRTSFRQALRGKFAHAKANLSGLASAINWGVKNRKLTRKHIF